MVTVVQIRAAGLACLVGGAAWMLLVAPFYGRESPVALKLLFAVANLLLMGGPLGLLALRAGGQGWTGRLGLVGAGGALLGQAAYVAAMGYALAYPAREYDQPFSALGALLVGVGMLLLGLAVCAARVLPGWRRVAPLLVGLYYAAMIPLQVAFFIIPAGTPSPLLLGAWGLTWMLLGHAIRTSVAGRVGLIPGPVGTPAP